jgi:hypothetical protein
MKSNHLLTWVSSLTIALAAASPARANDQAFVEALTPCLEYVRTEASGQHPQLLLDQGWLALMFTIPAEDGGGMGTDLCGELGNGGLQFGGAYLWPEALQHSEAINIKRGQITEAWLRRTIAAARAHAKTRADISRVTLTALPDGASVTRVYFKLPEASSGATVDLSMDAVVQPKDVRIPDQLTRAAENSAAPVVMAEAMRAPTVDPWAAFAMLRTITKANHAQAKVSRAVFSSFAALLEYRDADQTGRATQFDVLDGSAANLKDDLHAFPAAFKACAMTLSEIEAALAHLRTQTRYQKIAPRLLHLMLQCTAEKPKPHWNLTAMEPFEYFDLPAVIQKP